MLRLSPLFFPLCFSACALAAPVPQMTAPPTAQSAGEVPEAGLPMPQIRLPRDGGSCDLTWAPREVGSVVKIPAPTMTSAMVPVIEAVCACTAPGERVTIVARLRFAQGRAVVSAPDSEMIDQCLSHTNPSFPPSMMDMGSDCIDCGPRQYGVLRGSNPTPPPNKGIEVVFGFEIDRSKEL